MDTQAVEAIVSAIVEADGPQHRLDAPGMTPTPPCTAGRFSACSPMPGWTTNSPRLCTPWSRTLSTTPSPRTFVGGSAVEGAVAASIVRSLRRPAPSGDATRDQSSCSPRSPQRDTQTWRHRE